MNDAQDPRRELPKAYNPAAIEDRWAEYWVRERLFEVAPPGPAALAGLRSRGRDVFTILLPPPNVTGRLHMGHMLNQTEMDILTRWRRMSGDLALWLPGTDHAGIATQMMVERQLAEEGKKRQDLGRAAFVDRVWQWKRHYGGAILDQMKRLGASVDWSREYFTMDDNLSVAVREAFVRLHEQGLIYRGAYIVNWCPRCQTAISDLEVAHEEQQGKLWEIRYPIVGSPGEFLTVATTRPETLLGDVAVAVNPADERYQRLIGKTLRLPLASREIPVIADGWVKSDFGTGAVKVTPAHDPNDFAIGQRHGLPSINVMDETAHMNAEAGPYAGLDRYAARKKVLEDLESQALLGVVRDHVNSIGKCDRCKTVVEPRLSTQWFVAVNKQPSAGGASMAELARRAVRDGHIRITPGQYSKVYLDWMDNIYDWCISRQLWWGHRIPAWHCAACKQITVARQDPSACAHCGSADIAQETDVLDTWFSSGLLPVSVFGWPHPTRDFDAFYPTQLLVTGFDILFFWVARMIMLGCWFSKDEPLPDGSPRPPQDAVPFRDVYIHALVRDADRQKMSKTKGNVIDPIEIVERYGTDAVRFTLASMASPGTDIAFSEARTEGYRAFANKIWNAARFIFMNVEKAREAGIEIDRAALGAMPVAADEAPLEDRWITRELYLTAKKVNEALQGYRFDEAANEIYRFFWGDFCDWYLEIVKIRLDFGEKTCQPVAEVALLILLETFESALRLLSPFMPFLTEELWHATFGGTPPQRSIAFSKYPQGDDHYTGRQIHLGTPKNMKYIQELIGATRFRRKEAAIPEKSLVSIEVHAEPDAKAAFMANSAVIERLARVSGISYSDEKLPGNPYRYIAGGVRFESDLDLSGIEKTIDIPAERDRLTKDLAKQEKILASSEKQLSNPAFLSKAPAHIVEGLKKQAADAQLLIEKTRRALQDLG